MANEARIMDAFNAAKARVEQLKPGTYTLDDILVGDGAWDSLPWNNKGAVGERFRAAVIRGELAGVKVGAENPETGDREYIVG